MTFLNPSGAEVSAENLNATIEHPGKFNYRMLTGGASLVAEPMDGSADSLQIRTDNLTCEATFSFFRNQATVHSPGRGNVAWLKGGLTSRKYMAGYDPETPAALPIAMVLLYHITTNRGRAFRMG